MVADAFDLYICMRVLDEDIYIIYIYIFSALPACLTPRRSSAADLT
jgi:hypothetical protein